jgi:ubiquinone biosynthesis protein COQ9
VTVERSEVRDRAVRAMLPVAAEDGWNWGTVRAGLAAIGEDPGFAESHFPGGPVSAVVAWADLADREMEAAAAADPMNGLRTPYRVRRVVALRFAAAAPHKRALRRAVALLALPWNAGSALAATARTASAIWYAAHDNSADFSWYTRRASLGAIYAATLAYWLRDDDPDTADAMAFFDRRLRDLARLQRRRGGKRPASAPAA